jgi:protein involved in polysaccharide export with SLBB domain
MLRSLLALVLIPIGVHAQTPVQPPSSALVKDGYYVLQIGDEVAIRVFPHEQLSEVVRVRPDGRISAVMLDDFEAAGLTTQELDERLTTHYAKFFKEPHVSVIVRQFANVKVYIGGEVGQPGTIPLLGDLTIVGALFQAGGFKSTAKTDSVMLLRNERGAPVARRLNVKQILAKGAGDVKLQPFDVVYVPLSRIAAADRFVDQYMRQLIPVSLNAGFTYILGDRVVVR